MGRWCIALILIGYIASAGTAQLPLVHLTTFTHPVFGATGTVGVVSDSGSGSIGVLDFDQTASLHLFASPGNLAFSGTALTCTPSLPSPNGLTQNRLTGTFWLVDNHNGMPVVEMDAAGNCISGWTLSFSGNNPMSIVHHGPSDNLFVGSNGAISRWTRTGQQVGAPLFVSFPTGSWIVSALAWLPGSDHLLLAQSGGDHLFEIDLLGNLVSVTSLLPWGITNVQGLDYDPSSGQLLVADNGTVSIHIFDLQVSPQPMSFAFVPDAGGGATMTISNLPATTATGWTLASAFPGGPVGTGLLFGLFPDALTAALVGHFPTPATAHPVHWNTLDPQAWPLQAFSFAAGTFSSYSGSTWDLVVIALDANGFGIDVSDVVRTTF